MKVQTLVQFVGKTEPNREKDKTKFHYGVVATESNLTKELADEFRFVEFWSDLDLPVIPGKRYLATFNLIGDFLTFVSFDGEA